MHSRGQTSGQRTVAPFTGRGKQQTQPAFILLAWKRLSDRELLDQTREQ